MDPHSLFTVSLAAVALALTSGAVLEAPEHSQRGPLVHQQQLVQVAVQLSANRWLPHLKLRQVR